MTIYEIIKSTIENKNYDLTGILEKIEKRCFEGQLTEEQRDELVTLARDNAEAKNSVDVFAKLQELEARIKAMEEQKTDEPTEEYPEYVVGKWYYNGDKISYKGKNYECIAPKGTVCTWDPDEYPAYWKEV